MCFRILDIIQRWAELILSPLRCRSIAKALAWSYLVSRFDLKPMRVAVHLRRKRGSNGCRKRIIGCRSGRNREKFHFFVSTAIHQLPTLSCHNYTNNKYLSCPLSSYFCAGSSLLLLLFFLITPNPGLCNDPRSTQKITKESSCSLTKVFFFSCTIINYIFM